MSEERGKRKDVYVKELMRMEQERARGVMMSERERWMQC